MSDTEESRYPAAGEVIDGKYRINRILGEGGMGAVAGATHLLRKADVALKFISPDIVKVPGVVERFLNEAVAASQIDSEHVVKVFDVGRMDDGLPFLVMEYLQGKDLAEILEDEGMGGGLPMERAVHFVLQILRALHIAHAAGIIHRDLKPSNAFVITRDGEPDFVKLLDFGISKITTEGQDSQKLTQTNTGLGTPLYMSPEQARNARGANAVSDVYSVSAILYELLTGRTPYMAESPNDLLFRLFTGEPDQLLAVNPNVPQGLAEIVHRGLSKDPADRPQSAAEMADLIADYADARSTALVKRFRGNAGVASGAMPSLMRPSQAPADMSLLEAPTSGLPVAGAVTGLDATAMAISGGGNPMAPQPGSVVVKPPPAGGSTELGMASSPNEDAGDKSKRTVIYAGVAALALVVGAGAAFALKGAGGPDAKADPAAATSSTASSEPAATASKAEAPAKPAAAPPAASSAPKTEVTPAASSAPAPVKAPPKPTKTIKKPPVRYGGGQNNPFGVGIRQ